MPDLTFTLNADLTKARRAQILSRLAAEEGVAGVSMIDPDSPDPEIRGMGVLRLKPGTPPDVILTKLEALQDSLSAARSPSRRLIAPKPPSKPRKQGDKP